MLPCIASR